MDLAERLNGLGWQQRNRDLIDDPYDRLMFELVAELVAEVLRLQDEHEGMQRVLNSRTEHLV